MYFWVPGVQQPYRGGNPRTILLAQQAFPVAADKVSDGEKMSKLLPYMLGLPQGVGTIGLTILPGITMEGGHQYRPSRD